MSDDAQFVCTACHVDFEEDKEGVMTSCRKCGKMHCEECMDEHGQCVTCTEQGS